MNFDYLSFEPVACLMYEFDCLITVACVSAEDWALAFWTQWRDNNQPASPPSFYLPQATFDQEERIFDRHTGVRFDQLGVSRIPLK